MQFFSCLSYSLSLSLSLLSHLSLSLSLLSLSLSLSCWSGGGMDIISETTNWIHQTLFSLSQYTHTTHTHTQHTHTHRKTKPALCLMVFVCYWLRYSVRILDTFHWNLLLYSGGVFYFYITLTQTMWCFYVKTFCLFNYFVGDFRLFKCIQCFVSLYDAFCLRSESSQSAYFIWWIRLQKCWEMRWRFILHYSNLHFLF